MDTLINILTPLEVEHPLEQMRQLNPPQPNNTTITTHIRAERERERDYLRTCEAMNSSGSPPHTWDFLICETYVSKSPSTNLLTL